MSIQPMPIRFGGQFTFRLPQGKTVADLGSALYQKDPRFAKAGIEEQPQGDVFFAVANRLDAPFREVLAEAGITPSSYRENNPEDDAKLDGPCCGPGCQC